MDTNVPDAVTELLSALADTQRQRVLGAFIETRCREMPATEIAERCRPLSRPAVSHHLAVMRRGKVLTARKEGKHIYYAINVEHVMASLQQLLRFIETCCATPAARDAPAKEVHVHG